MNDDQRAERAREFSRRELLRVGWVLPVVASIAAACSEGGDWTGLRARERASDGERRQPTRGAHADAEHIDAGTGVDHADLPHADSGPETPVSEPSATTRRDGETPSHTDQGSHTDRGRHTDIPHNDVPVHTDVPHGDEHTDFGGPEDPAHLDTPYGDHTDSSDGFTVHDDSPHVDEIFADEPLIDHGDTPHVDVPHGDTLA